ncbi:MAG: transaldolase family protein, partial [Calditrichota bacterium]
MNPLLQLIEHGQSYWIDNLSRHMITSGDLKKRVTEQGLRGITSNPSIFDKAITKSNDYDAQIKELIRSGKKNVKEIYDALTIKDIQDACDILRPVFDESDGLDGFVSLEVSPYLARHTNETMAEARRLFKAVNRPNCLIKIPGTGEGVPAIEQMLYEGININITLLFSIQSYETVARAYIKALERRLNDKEDITKVSSVASFFISRIDVLVDELLHH